MVDVVVVVPMLGRAHLVPRLLESLHGSTGDARVLFMCHRGDVDVLKAVVKAGVDYMVVTRAPIGDYARKVNVAYRSTTEPLIFLGASDLFFLPGWLDACRAELRPGIGVVGTNDMGSPRVIAGEHSTHSLVTREYADQFGTVDGPGQILCEAYPHEFVDDELVGTARFRNAYAHAFDARVKHEHPNWYPDIPTDEVYRGQGRRLATGRRIFNRRRHRWT